MKQYYLYMKRKAALGISVLFLLIIVTPTAPALNLSNAPLFLVPGSDPLVMLNMSKDHQLFFKAYNDYSDLDNDSTFETTYTDTITYTGYFDSGKCYTYNSGQGRFEPAALATGTNSHYCSSQWSGNFMNWASMSRMDLVRKLLYGGKRSTDSAADTVLERAYLPHDAHSWAKFFGATATEQTELGLLTPFNSTERANGITFCNTTAASSGSVSQTVTDPPLIRVAGGNYALWAGNERWQCRWSEEGVSSNGNVPAQSGLSAASSNPSQAANGLGQDNYIARIQVCVSGLLGNEDCTQYPSTNYKPTGLLHDFGEDGSIKFGLMTGSYEKNISGGVLRKNIETFANEVNVATDGTFISPLPADSIVRTLDKIRIYGYQYSNGTYRFGTGDNCTWQLTDITEGTCTSWGNPLSEMYLESLRYFTGLNATPAFVADDSGRIAGLNTATWSDPLNNQNWCSSINVLNFNASVSSYDNDQMGGLSGVASGTSATTLTNTVGDDEGISGNSYFIGRNGTINNELCTGKTISTLGTAFGLCPEAPTVSGSYLMAGAAWMAHTEQIRSDITEAIGDDEALRVNTYGIALSTGVPRIKIPIPSSTDTVTILPAYRLDRAQDGGGALVDFKIVAQDLTAGTGTFYVNWEDSEQGGDFDQDVWGLISYSISGSNITVTTDTIAESTGNPQGFGYVISGTTRDGVHFHSGIEGFTFVDPTGVTACTNCQVGDAATSYTYTTGPSTTQLLEDPMFYAAKWGGFTDLDADSKPNTTGEWDIADSNGDPNPDGIPDNFFRVTNPAGLKASLNTALEKISRSSSSASAVGVNAGFISSSTRLFQAQFESESWTGHLLLKGFDTTTNAILNVNDWYVELATTPEPIPPDTQPASNFADILMAQVNGLSKTSGGTFSSRQIITTKYDGGTPTFTPTAFTWAGIGAINQATLGGGNATLGGNRVNYLRGDTSLEDNINFRKRRSGKTVQGDGTLGIPNVLGDIIHSSPIYVAEPPFFYTFTGYQTFQSTNSSREAMVYVGANDGMLHGLSAATGEEKIAYVPSMVYSNLVGYTQPTYTNQHKYFVDLTPTVGDAYGNFGTCTTPPCWRSVLVGGLRGGGKGYFALDVTDPTDFATAETTPTNVVLWEFPNPNTSTADVADLGYSYSEPLIVRIANGDRWVAIFGNGYNSTGKAGGGAEAALYAIDITDGSVIKKLSLGGNSSDNGLSSPTAVDIDNDNVADLIYAGDLDGQLWRVDITGNPNSWQADKIFQAQDGSATPIPQPITSRPDVGNHPTGEAGYMVYFGTGKYIETTDKSLDSTRVQSFYGIWDEDGNTLITRAELQSQSVSTPTDAGGTALPDFRTVTNNPVDWTNAGGSGIQRGCRIDFDGLAAPGSPAATAGELIVSNPVLRPGKVLFTTTIPSDQGCTFGGEGWLMEVNPDNCGLPSFNVLDTNDDGVIDNNDTTVAGKLSKAGPGPTPIPITKDDTTEIKFQTGTKAIIEPVENQKQPGENSGRQSWRQIQ